MVDRLAVGRKPKQNAQTHNGKHDETPEDGVFPCPSGAKECRLSAELVIFLHVRALVHQPARMGQSLIAEPHHHERCKPTSRAEARNHEDMQCKEARERWAAMIGPPSMR